MSRRTNVLLFDCLNLVEFPSCHSVTHEQLFAGAGNCVQSPFQSCSIAPLAWLGTRPPCPLHLSRICYLALCYRDDTHTNCRHCKTVGRQHKPGSRAGCGQQTTFFALGPPETYASHPRDAQVNHYSVMSLSITPSVRPSVWPCLAVCLASCLCCSWLCARSLLSWL